MAQRTGRLRKPSRTRSGALAPRVYDSRDWVFNAVELGLDPDPSDERFGLTHSGTPRDQGDVPCCVSAALVTCMETLDELDGERTDLSVLFHYHVAANPKRNGSLPGLEVDKGLAVAVTQGVCPAELHYGDITEDKAREGVSEEAVKAAEKYRLAVAYDRRRNRRGYRSLDTAARVKDWRAALKGKMPILFVFFMTDAYNALFNGEAIHRNPGAGRYRYRHAAVVLEYDASDGGAFRVKDSRGARIGDKGYWFLPAALVSGRTANQSFTISQSFAICNLRYDET